MADYEDQDGFNSSDVEVPEVENPHAHRGMQTIQAMIVSAFEDRVESKIQSKSLTHSTGAPGTVIARSTWLNRFDSFMLHTLKKNVNQIPTGPDIERFFFSWPKSSKGKSRDSIAFTYVASGIKHLIAALRFRHHHFRLDGTDAARLQSMMDKLRRDGLITKDPTREKLWITSTLVRQVVTALVSDAIDYGTHSWDVICSKSLGILLQSALSCRAGDIARNTQYKGVEYLQWEHIDMRFIVRRNGSKQWVARITLAYQKGWKDDQSKNDSVQLESVTIPEFFIACPVKWLLILALRTGVVAQHCIEDLELAAEANLTHSIVWLTPKRPVLCAFRSHGSMLKLDQPATNAQLLKSLRSACDLVGMVSAPITHDLRRGAAADIAHLPSSVRGTSATETARVLGHQNGSRDSGITSRYIGGLRDDTWGKRLASDFVDDFSPELAQQPFKRARQSTARVKEICEELGLDSVKTKERDQARGIGRARLRDEWIEKASNSSHSNKNGNSEDISPSHELESPTVFPLADNTTPPTVLAIDPRLLNLTEILTTGVDDVDEAMSTLDGLNTKDSGSQSHFPQNVHSFISKFASINVYRNEVVGDTMPAGAVSGGSRDAPTRWLYSCVNAPLCDKTFISRHLQMSHASNCKPAAKVIHPFACELCTATFLKQSGLNAHVKHVHNKDWVPKACEEEGCTSTEVFKTKSLYQSHRQNCHSAWSPVACPKCPGLGSFMKRNAYVFHIKKIHPDNVKELMPGKTKTWKRASLPETANWKTSKCLVPQCPHHNSYNTREKYMQHLRVMHGIKAKDSQPYMPKKANQKEQM